MEDLIGVELVVLHVLLIVWLFCMHLSILFYSNTSLVYKTFYSKTSFHCIKLLVNFTNLSSPFNGKQFYFEIL